jgi:hypothetical protein
MADLIAEIEAIYLYLTIFWIIAHRKKLRTANN